MADCRPRVLGTEIVEALVPPGLCSDSELLPAGVCADGPLPLPEECCDTDPIDRGWYNQETTVECPPGTVGTPVTIPANTVYSTESQEAANVAAYELALEELECYQLVEFLLSTTSLSATPTLIGFSEFADPSVPPKKYLVRTGSGRYDRNDFTTSPGPDFCAGVCNSSDAQSLEGYDSYNQTSGALTLAGIVRNYQSLDTCPPTVQTGFTIGLPDILTTSNALLFTITNTKTRSSRVGTEFCTPSDTEGGRIKFCYGEQQLNLSSEDTEANAIARATYSAGTASIAMREQRGTGEFSFDHVRVFGSLQLTSLVPGLFYTVRYHTVATPIDSGPIIDDEHIFSFTADSASRTENLGELPCQSGYTAQYADFSATAQ